MKPFRQYFLDLDQRALNRTLKTLHPRRTVACHDNSLQTEETCADMSCRRQFGLQAFHQR